MNRTGLLDITVHRAGRSFAPFFKSAAAIAAPEGHKAKVLDPEQAQLKVLDADADSPGGWLEGYASVFGNVDNGKDVVIKGAFAKTLKERLKKGYIKLVDSHEVFMGGGTKSIIGVVTEAKEDEHGLWFRAKLSTVQAAQDIRTKVKEGILSALSFGYDVIKAAVSTENPDVTELKELKLYEISVVPWGMNDLAQLTGVKGDDPPSPPAELVASEEEITTLLSGMKAAIPGGDSLTNLLGDMKAAAKDMGAPMAATMPPEYSMVAADAAQRCETCAGFDKCCSNGVNGGCDYYNCFVMINGVCAAFNFPTGDPEEEGSGQ